MCLKEFRWVVGLGGIGLLFMGGRVATVRAQQAAIATTSNGARANNWVIPVQMQTPLPARSEPDGLSLDSTVKRGALEEARVTLSMKDAPLVQIVDLLSETTTARFRFGAPPDIVVSPSFRDEPLISGLENLLRPIGWTVRPAASDIYLLPRGSADFLDSARRGSGWSYWSGARPPASWLEPARLRVPILESADRHIGRVHQGIDLPTRWIPCPPVQLLSVRPGFQVPEVARPEGQPTYLRWTLNLRFVPSGARLLLDTSTAATLFINGAPLARNLVGLRTLDLSRSLLRGENILGLKVNSKNWSQVNSRDISEYQRTLIAAPYLLRYEWLFDAQPGSVAAASTDDNR